MENLNTATPADSGVPQTPDTGDVSKINADKEAFLKSLKEKIAGIMAMKGESKSMLKTQLLDVLKKELLKMGIDTEDPASAAKAQELISQLPPDILAMLSGEDVQSTPETVSPLKDTLKAKADTPDITEDTKDAGVS